MSTRPIAAERSNEFPVVRKPLSLLKNILAANIVGRHFFVIQVGASVGP
ncbi:MAG: hypothetical protein ACJAVT_001377 [Yoonia sp.]|jgi:hypothetical protein